MTTMELNDSLPSERAGFFSRIAKLFAAWRAANRRQDALLELSHLDARLLRDIGIEPMDVYDAVNRKVGHSVLLNPIRRSSHE